MASRRIGSAYAPAARISSSEMSCWISLPLIFSIEASRSRRARTLLVAQHPQIGDLESGQLDLDSRDARGEQRVIEQRRRPRAALRPLA